VSTATAKAPLRRRRIWSEFVPWPTLTSPEVLALLRQYELEVLVAVMPANLPGLGDLVEAFDAAGVSLGLWPMVEDADGRWGSTLNAQHYADFVLRVVQRAPPGSTVAIDLEPPIDLVQGLLAGQPRALLTLVDAGERAPGAATLRQLLVELNRRGLAPLAAVNPVLLADGRGPSAWQWLFGTPIDGLPFETVSFMAYTSLLEGYSRGLVDRRVARALLCRTAESADKHWGTRSSLSIGAVGAGALGDEQPYRDVAELADDVALARAGGVHDLALFDLSGVLARDEPETWLEAFVHTPAAKEMPPLPKRALLVRAALRSGGAMIGWVRRRKEPGATANGG